MSIWASSSYLPYLFREKYNYLHDLIWLYSHHSYKCICIPWFFLVNFERNTNIPRRKKAEKKKHLTWLLQQLLLLLVFTFFVCQYTCFLSYRISVISMPLCLSERRSAYVGRFRKKTSEIFLYEDDDDDRVCVHFPTWNFYHFLRTLLIISRYSTFCFHCVTLT